MLRQLRLQIELEQCKRELGQCLEKKRGFETRKADIEKRFAEAAEGIDLAGLEGELTALETEIEADNTDTRITELEKEITRISNELKTIGDNSGAGTGNDGKKKEEREQDMNKYQIRKLLESGEYYERADVKEFYAKLQNIRAVGGEGLTVPNVVVNRIIDIMGDYTTVYPLVNKIRAKGTTRILIDTDTTAATWIEMSGAIPAGNVGTITNVDFDGYKVGKVTFVDNYMLQDSIVNLDDYVSKKLARAIGLALDAAIVNGTGSANKQPEGIIPALDSDHKVTVTDPAGIADIVRPISEIDDGADSVGNIVAVMKRKTYYNRLMDYHVATTAAGEVIGKLPNINSPNLLGLDVVFNNNIPEDQILYGEFSKYTLVERESISIDKSEHVKFTEDQTGFRGKGRFDGKPTNSKAFVLVTLEYAE